LKIIFDNDLTINIVDDVFQKQNIIDSTPQTDFLRSHFKDIMKEMGALKSILGTMKAKTVFDLMAGCGFSGKMIEKICQPDRMLLNDFDPDCFAILEKNFDQPGVDIFQGDIFEFIWKESDLTFIDFNSFTLNKIDQWSDVLRGAADYSDKLIITDSACYGFKMGNLKSYGCKTEKDYYFKTSWIFEKEFKAYLTMVCHFGPAALLLFDRVKRSNLKFIEPETISSMILESEGLLC